MKRRRYAQVVWQILFITLLLCSCATQQSTPNPTLEPAAASPPTLEPSATKPVILEPAATITPTPDVSDLVSNPYAGPGSQTGIDRLGRGAIWDIQFDPDGETLVVFSGTGAWRYDPQSLKTIAAPADDLHFSIQSDEPILSSPDGKYLASISNINRAYAVRLHDAATGELLQTLEGGSGGKVECAAWSPDGRLIASGTGLNRIFVWEAKSGKWQNKLDPGQRTIELAFSPDGKILASAHESGTIHIWELAGSSLERTLQGPGNLTSLLAWSPDGRLLASKHSDGSILLWETSSWKNIQTLAQANAYINALAWAPDSQALATRADATLSLWDSASGKKLLDLEAAPGRHLNLLWSPDGSWLADRTADGRLTFWEADSGELLGQILGHLSAVDQLAWSPQGSLLASAVQDTGLILWDTTSWQPEQILWQAEIDSLTDLAWSPDGQTLAGSFLSEALQWWDAANNETRSLDIASFAATSLDWSPDGSLLASGMKDTSVIFWEPGTGEQLRLLLGHSGRVNDVIFSPDGSRLASSARSTASLNLEIIVWEVATGKELGTIRKDVRNSDNEAQLAWSADGQALAAYLDDGTRMLAFDSVTGRELPSGSELPFSSELVAGGGQSGPSKRVTYSPDYARMAEGTASGLIFLSANLELPLAFVPGSSPTEAAAPELALSPTPMAELGPGSIMLSSADLRPMVFIPAGPFLMGAGPEDSMADPDEKPQHEVLLDAFWVDQFEVTHLEYDLCVQAGGCNPPEELDNNGFAYEYPAAIPSAPVVNVSWNDAVAYCTWAGKRLPTEAEWEKAARGTDARIYPWGNDPEAHAKAWFCENCIYDPNFPEVQDDFSRPATIGSFPEGISPFGVYDLAGNVWEWVIDWYASDTYNQPNQVNPVGPESGSLRIVRGGSWTTPAASMRTTYRAAHGPRSAWIDVGFRCVMADDRSQLIRNSASP